MGTIVIYVCLLFLLLCILFLVYASAVIRSGIYVKAVCRLNTNERVVALTFDDGPDERITPQLLDVLKKYRTQAVFFCIGKQIAGNKDIVLRMISEGHLVGNHSFSHPPVFPLFMPGTMIADIRFCEQAIERATRQKTLSLFRPPFGVTNPTLRHAVNKLGYTVVGWSIRSFDTLNRQHPDKIVERVMKNLKPGSIILFHDNLSNTPQVVETVIKKALEQGFRFVRIDEYL